MAEYEPVRKRIVIEVTWDGAADEGAYGQVVCDHLREGDASGLTEANVLYSTHLGVTPSNPKANR